VSNSDKAKNQNSHFKQDAAKLVLKKGYTHQQAADSGGITKCPRRWVKAERKPTSVAAVKCQPEYLAKQSELTRLYKEIEQLRMERDIIPIPISSHIAPSPTGEGWDEGFK